MRKLNEFLLAGRRVAKTQSIYLKSFIVINLIVLGLTNHTFGDVKKLIFGRPEGTYDISNLENINHFSGSLDFSLPLITVQGRGSSGYNITARTQNLWSGESFQVPDQCDSDGNCTYVTYYSFTNWNPGFVVNQTPQVYRSESNQFERAADINPWRAKSLTTIKVVMPDGTVYELFDEETKGKRFDGWYYQIFPPETYGLLRGKVFRSTDGSDITFVSTLDIRDRVPMSTNYNQYRLSGYVVLKDGTRYELNDGRLISIKDRNGNTIRFETELSSSGDTLKITDSIGRIIRCKSGVPTTGTPPSQFISTITYDGFQGTPRIIKLHYTKLQNALRPAMNGYPASTIKTIQQLFDENNPYIAAVGEFNPTVLTKIEYPDERTYEFKYNSYGELSLVTLPTKGQIAQGLFKVGVL